MSSRKIRAALAGAVAAGVGAALTVAGPAASAATAATAATATAHRHITGAEHAVFVQTNAATGNTVLAYHRAGDGSLSRVGEFPTGGLGGTAVGAPLDALASQGSLVYDARHALLLAVNAGSDSITVFRVQGDELERTQVISSRGEFPVSLTVHGDLAYVVNGGGDGSVAGYRIADRRLTAIPDDVRSLGLDNAAVPGFLTSPAQVGFSPDGRHVVVTAKANGTIDVFDVRPNGRISAHPVVTASAGPVPFAFTFDPAGDLVVTNAGDSSVATYRIEPSGRLVTLDAGVGDGGAALCWITRSGDYYYGANAGSATLSSYRILDGHPNLVAAVAATTNAGPIDMSTTRDGRFLYVQNAVAGTVQGFAIGADGALTLVSTTTGLPAFDNGGMEGIVAI